MNKVVLIGRLTKDPELKFTPGTGMAVTTVTLAVDRYNASTKQREADFIPVVIWGKQAEATANHMRKGSLMAVSGRISVRNYEDKEGIKRYVTEVVASETSFLSSKKDGQQGFNPQENPFQPGGWGEDITPVEEDSIPF